MLRQLLLGAAIMLVADPAMAAESVPSQAMPATIDFATAGQIRGMIAEAAKHITPGQSVLTQPVLLLAPYKANLEYRQSAANAATHQSEAELFIVVDGAGTLVEGGTLLNPKAVDAHNLSGSGIVGGASRHVSVGDVFIVPEGTAHWFNMVEKRLVLISIKIPRVAS
jgi:mannose-6-phosphate isomerase-like protein (cupin superfamily)